MLRTLLINRLNTLTAGAINSEPATVPAAALATAAAGQGDPGAAENGAGTVAAAEVGGAHGTDQATGEGSDCRVRSDRVGLRGDV